MTDYKIIIDKNACIGAGNCVKIDPATYKLAEGKAEILKSKISDDDLKKNLNAVKNCPTNAIKIIDISTEKEVKP